MGVPTVTIVTDQFVTLARGTQKSQGLTDMCFVTVPHPIGMLPKEQVDAKVDAAFGDIVKAATQWQPVKEKEAAQESPYPAKTFKFTGTYADVNKLFAKRKWSLSLPIIPPTVDRVREMLKGTKRAPSEVLWVVPPRQGMLTVELVAVLGVMAGAQPEHMPLLLATIDAMKAPEAAWRGTSTTTAPTSPLIVISGPIVEKLKLNAGTGTAGGENPVTNALGYFVNLVGDVVGGYQLAHAAYAEGEAALADILGEDKPYGTMPVPVCTYTLPVLASVGLTTEAAEAAGYEPVLGAFDYGANGMALAEGAVGRVFVVADKNTTKTLGVSIVGENSAEMIAFATAAVAEGWTTEQWEKTVVAHPSLCEMVREAALAAFGRSVHTA